MQVIKKGGLLLLGLLLFTITTNVHAEEYKLSVQHLLIETVQAEEDTDVTLKMTVTNTGTCSLKDIKLVQLEPIKLLEPYSQPLSITALSVDETAIHTWNLSSFPPADFYQMDVILKKTMTLEVEAADEHGEAVCFVAMSEPNE